MTSRIRHPDTLVDVLAELRRLSAEVRRSRLRAIREELELDEMYYEAKGSTGGLGRVRRCLALVDASLEEL